MAPAPSPSSQWLHLNPRLRRRRCCCSFRAGRGQQCAGVQHRGAHSCGSGPHAAAGRDAATAAAARRRGRGRPRRGRRQPGASAAVRVPDGAEKGAERGGVRNAGRGGLLAGGKRVQPQSSQSPQPYADPVHSYHLPTQSFPTARGHLLRLEVINLLPALPLPTRLVAPTPLPPPGRALPGHSGAASGQGAAAQAQQPGLPGGAGAAGGAGAHGPCVGRAHRPHQGAPCAGGRGKEGAGREGAWQRERHVMSW